MTNCKTYISVKYLAAPGVEKVVIAVVIIIYSFFCQVDSQTQHIPLRRPVCNSFFREVPAAILEGAGGYKMGNGHCDVTLSAPDRDKWMLKMDKMAIHDCEVNVQVFDTYMSLLDSKSVLNIGCASSDPGIVYINSSTMTVRLRHYNSTDYSFNIIVTARKVSSKPNAACSGFRCDTGACIAKSLICDAIDNCFDYSDESNNDTARCEAESWPFQGENWGVLASVLGAAVVLGVTAAFCRHIRNKRRGSLDELYDLHEGPYVHKYAYRYAVIRAPKKPNQTNVVLGRDGHMHYNATNV